MTRLIKTDNKQFATEKLARMREYIKQAGSPDTVELKEFQDLSGHTFYEVWLQHNTDLSQKADHR